MSRNLLSFKKLKRVLDSTNNGPVLLFKIIIRHRNCFMSSFATDGKNGLGLKLEKIGSTFSSFKDMLAKTAKKTIKL